MDQTEVPDKDQLERLKKKYGIDEIVAKRYDVPKEMVTKKFNPRLVRILLKYLTVKDFSSAT